MIQLFSSYNNDSLTILLSVSFLMSLWSYWRTERWLYWILSVVTGTLAVYTKFSAIYLLLSVAIVVCGTICLRILPLRKAFVIAGTICIPGIILLPWLYFHNYCSTGKLFPHNVEVPTGRVMVAAKMENNGGIVRFLFAPPGISWAQWTSPYAIARGKDAEWEWTKKDLVSSTLVTSVLGEWDYSSLMRVHPRSAVTFAWLAIALRLGLLGLLVIGWVPRMALARGNNTHLLRYTCSALSVCASFRQRSQLPLLRMDRASLGSTSMCCHQGGSLCRECGKESGRNNVGSRYMHTVGIPGCGGGILRCKNLNLVYLRIRNSFGPTYPRADHQK